MSSFKDYIKGLPQEKFILSTMTPRSKENFSPEDQLDLVKRDLKNVRKIKNPTIETIKYVLSHNPFVFEPEDLDDWPDNPVVQELRKKHESAIFRVCYYDKIGGLGNLK